MVLRVRSVSRVSIVCNLFVAESQRGAEKNTSNDKELARQAAGHTFSPETLESTIGLFLGVFDFPLGPLFCLIGLSRTQTKVL